MDALEAFARAIDEEDARIDLARACLLVAGDAYPALDVDGYVGELERYAKRLASRLGVDIAPEEKVVALNEFLFDDLGYVGNTRDYYDPRNSHLNEVIDRRTGIPITLAVMYMEIGRRIGLSIEGVSFPGHFLVRLKVRGGTLVLDPFSGGMAQSEDELRERLKRVTPAGMGAGNAGNVPVEQLPLETFLEPAGKRQILARLLRNLKGIYRKKNQPERLLEVLNRLIIVAPDSSSDLRDRGLVYRQLECWRPALQDLTAYLAREPEALDAEEIRASTLELTLRCGRLN